MKSFSLQELAELVHVEWAGDSKRVLSGVDTLDAAGPSDLSFLANPRYLEAMKKSEAGAICIDRKTPLVEGKNYLISDSPSQTFQQIAEIVLFSTSTSGFHAIHPTAVIHESVKIAPNVTIGPFTSIDQGCSIGEGTMIASHVAIGYEVEIGDNCTIHPHCTIRERSRLGNRVILQPGVVIGSCGFGYVQDQLGRHIKLEQMGIVILEDDVEIGANTTIDRSRFKATIIGKGCKIDNLCQIAHNVEVGDHTIMAAQTGIAGSVKIGKHVMFGGQAGVLGHVHIEDRVMLATRSGVSKSLKAGKYRGSPAIPIDEYHRQEVHVRKLGEYIARLKELEKKIDKIALPSI